MLLSSAYIIKPNNVQNIIMLINLNFAHVANVKCNGILVILTVIVRYIIHYALSNSYTYITFMPL